MKSKATFHIPAFLQCNVTLGSGCPSLPDSADILTIFTFLLLLTIDCQCEWVVIQILNSSSCLCVSEKSQRRGAVWPDHVPSGHRRERLLRPALHGLGTSAGKFGDAFYTVVFFLFYTLCFQVFVLFVFTSCPGVRAVFVGLNSSFWNRLCWALRWHC